MRNAMLAGVLVLLPACGGDQRAGTLRPGDHVLLLLEQKNGKTFDDLVVVIGRKERIGESQGFARVPNGTRAIVLSDAGSKTPDPKKRWVQIKIDEGEKAGTVADAMRGWLIPAK